MMTLRKARPMNVLERGIWSDIERLREYYAGLMAGTTRWRNAMRQHLNIYARRAHQLGVMPRNRLGNAPAALAGLFSLLAKANKAQADHGGQPITLPNHSVIMRRILGVDERAMSDMGSLATRLKGRREKKRAFLKRQAKARGRKGRRARRMLRAMARQDRRMRRANRRFLRIRSRLIKRAQGRGIGARIARRLIEKGDALRARIQRGE
jgi:hypothetical protein